MLPSSSFSYVRCRDCRRIFLGGHLASAVSFLSLERLLTPSFSSRQLGGTDLPSSVLRLQVSSLKTPRLVLSNYVLIIT